MCTVNATKLCMDPETSCKLLLIAIFINSELLNKEGNDKITIWYEGKELERNSWLVSMLLHSESGRKLVLRSKSNKVSRCSLRVEIRAFRLLEKCGTNSSVMRGLIPGGTEAPFTSLLEPNNSKNTSHPDTSLWLWKTNMQFENIVFCLWLIWDLLSLS
jgi:hypothetical protein